MLGGTPSTARRLRAEIRDEAATGWGVRNGFLVDALVLMPFVGAVVVIAAWGYRPVFHLLTREDHILEWLQFAGFAGATALGAAIAVALWRAGRRPMGVLYAAFALGCFFIAGEEISWGQRLLGYGTPQELERVNHQGAVTVHNIGGFSQAFNGVMLVIGAYGALAPWLLRRSPRPLPRDITALVVPALFLTPAFLMLFAYKALRFTAFPDPRAAVVSFGEWPEFCLAYALVTFALLTERRVWAGRPAPAPAAGQALAAPYSRRSPGASPRASESRSSAT
jgi:hypothetical protein